MTHNLISKTDPNNLDGGAGARTTSLMSLRDEVNDEEQPMNTTMMVMMPGNNADTSILSMGNILPDPNAALEKGGDSPNFQKEDKKASIFPNDADIEN